MHTHTQHRIKSLDLVCMKELEKKVQCVEFISMTPGMYKHQASTHSASSSIVQVNIIPVIAKADTISRSELSQFKARVRLSYHIISYHIWVAGGRENEKLCEV